jgi:RND family efflux transporter MFP subunit
MKYYRFIALLLIAGLTACGGKKEENKGEDSVEKALPSAINEVTVAKLQLVEFNHELVSNGKLSARRFVDLKFESAEPIAAIFVKNGDHVGKGQKIAELSTFRLSNKVAQTKTALENAKLELQDVLIGQGFALKDSARVPKATMQLARIKSGYDQAVAQYQLAVYELHNAVLRAPFDGIVANLFSKPYNTASVADVFCSIIDSHSLEADFTVLESELPLIKMGDRVEVSPFAMTNVKAEGKISEINPLVGTDGMVKVKATVGSSTRLFEGMNVRVSIHRSVGKQLVVPKGAVVLRSGKQVVFTLSGNKAYWNYVHTGLENADSYTITDGLKEGATIITSGNINLAHESPVKVISRQQTDDK